MRIPVPEVLLPAEALGTVHFIGIGGAALSGIARIMARRGVPVSGSDDNDTPFLPSLRELGVVCHLGYSPDHLDDADTVVVTTAAREDNPEVVEARRRGLRILPRSAGLAAVMDRQRVVAVTGTHGKTTTTALLTVALRAADGDPTYAIGGVLSATGRNADLGAGEVFVAEADESDGAFLVYSPYAAIVTNVEADHLDIWGTEEAYAAAFVDFLDRLDPAGFVVCCVDDPGAARLAVAARTRGLDVVTVGEGEGADLRLTQVLLPGRDGFASSTTLVSADGEMSLDLRIPGRHYLVDAAAAFAAGRRLGYSTDALVAGLRDFTGTQRRMEFKGEACGVRVYDSYAHHPREIVGDLEAARSVVGPGRLLVAFQPHLVSRTRLFGREMGEALGAADEVVILDVYLAREDPDPEVTGALVAAAVPLAADRVHYVPDLRAVPAALSALAAPGDVVLTLGAGSVTSVGPDLLALLEERSDGPA